MTLSQFWRRKPQLVRWFAYILIAAMLLISLRIHDSLYQSALPYAYAMLEIEVQSQCEELIAAAMSEISADCETYVTYDRNSSGDIKSIRIDGAEVNILKSEITALLISRLEDHGKICIGVPFGSITGFDLLFGKGPDIKIELPVSGTVKCDITDSFSDAGINQTMHRTSALLTLELILLLPEAGTQTITLSEEFELARTVIVGNIPQTVVER